MLHSGADATSTATAAMRWLVPGWVILVPSHFVRQVSSSVLVILATWYLNLMLSIDDVSLRFSADFFRSLQESFNVSYNVHCTRHKIESWDSCICCVVKFNPPCVDKKSNEEIGPDLDEKDDFQWTVVRVASDGAVYCLVPANAGQVLRIEFQELESIHFRRSLQRS